MNKKAIEFLKVNQTGNAKELEKGMISVNVVLEKVMKDLISNTQALQRNRKYKEVIDLIEVQKDVNEIIERNEEIIDKLKGNEKVTEAVAPLSEYAVDPNIPFDLEEDFRFKRPYAFQVEEDLIEVSTWREVLIRTAEYLYYINPEIIETFPEDQSMHWGETFNFARDESLLRNPAIIQGSDIYIETSKTSNAVRQLVKKMLDKYNIDNSKYKVFLRADYTERYNN